jgi:hypothetical protein
VSLLSGIESDEETKALELKTGNILYGTGRVIVENRTMETND